MIPCLGFGWLRLKIRELQRIGLQKVNLKWNINDEINCALICQECRISCLWEKARYDRWKEGKVWVKTERKWVQNWFAYRETWWMERVKENEEERKKGHLIYAWKQVGLWNESHKDTTVYWTIQFKEQTQCVEWVRFPGPLEPMNKGLLYWELHSVLKDTDLRNA